MNLAMPNAASSPSPSRLRGFITEFSALLDGETHEAAILSAGERLLAGLVRHDDWLPPEFAQPHPEHYRQYLLHCDSGERFSIVSFVWGPGQQTPIHDHGVWGLIGMLRGTESAQRYVIRDGRPVRDGASVKLVPGDTETLSPGAGDIHQVRNDLEDQVSISIHVYGADIGAVRRSVFPPDGGKKPFVSGYANHVLPNIWGARN